MRDISVRLAFAIILIWILATSIPSSLRAEGGMGGFDGPDKPGRDRTSSSDRGGGRANSGGQKDSGGGSDVKGGFDLDKADAMCRAEPTGRGLDTPNRCDAKNPSKECIESGTRNSRADRSTGGDYRPSLGNALLGSLKNRAVDCAVGGAIGAMVGALVGKSGPAVKAGAAAGCLTNVYRRGFEETRDLSRGIFTDRPKESKHQDNFIATGPPPKRVGSLK